MLARPRAALALLLFLLTLALPASASAANFVVNSTGDEPDAVAGGVCETAGGKCSLRAAIEVTNLTLAEKDRIEFSGTVFKGTLASTIEPATALPPITVPLEIDGGDCSGEDGPDAPCVGVKGPSGAAALAVENANAVTIKGLSITGAQFGIDVVSSSENFKAQNDWIGLNLNAAKEGNVTGIFFDAGSDGAIIGGPAASERNVISGNEGDGLDLNGASETTIQGNYFGVSVPEPLGLPGGSTQIANGKDIEITDSTASGGVKAEDNVVGATIEGAALTSQECDGGCNVISGAFAGVDLNGNGAGQNEAPASGPTLIHGNFIGVSASGTGTVANSNYGVLAGHADNATVGEFPLGDANYFAGSSEAIATEEGESFIARGNTFGVGPGGAKLTRPGKAIFALDQAVSPPSIEQNLISAGSIGIEQVGGVGHLTGNEVSGGSIGIYAKGEPGGGLIASNSIEAASENGILVEGPDNEVRANSVLESGEAGIRFRNPPGIAMTGGLIGGGTGEKENVVIGSGGPAIEIVEAALEPGSATEIARNRGILNGGPFIALVAGANGGIEPPPIAAALQSSASGTATPGATVRVFSKNETDPGEIHGFLAETEADGSGNWKVTYKTVAVGTLVTATQTASGATSQLTGPVAAAADPGNGGGGGNSGGGNSGGQGPTPDTTAPTVKITKGPKAKSTSTTAKFKFQANEAGSTFQCKLDKGKFKKCSSPKTYKKLKPGKHVFKVRATDKAGNVGAAAKRKFTVLP
ncbi:MAG TPA: CSLREA domain-containing protein [Solirubrobacterales bacterium]|nr:CSLREA domain-containing protein [Solirubrobacterales bacterium]